MNLPHRMAHRLPHDPKNLRHVQITMAHRPSRTGFWIGVIFLRDLVHFTSVREFFDLTPNVKERTAHLQDVFYQPKFSDVIHIVGTTYLISKNVIHDGFSNVFPIGTLSASKYSGNSFRFCSRSLCRSMYVHIVFMKFLCGLQRFVPFICLKPDTKRCKPHGTPST